MIVKLRLHKTYDFDLMLLICGKKIKVATAIKRALDSCIKGEQWCENYTVSGTDLENLPVNKECSINITEQSHIDFLSTIGDISKNSILKALLRKYYQCDFTYLFLNFPSTCVKTLIIPEKKEIPVIAQENIAKEILPPSNIPVHKEEKEIPKPVETVNVTSNTKSDENIHVKQNIKEEVSEDNGFDLFGCLNDMMENY